LIPNPSSYIQIISGFSVSNICIASIGHNLHLCIEALIQVPRPVATLQDRHDASTNLATIIVSALIRFMEKLDSTAMV
jgi:hypothetical protein